MNVESYSTIDVDEISVFSIEGKKVNVESAEIIKSDDLSQITRLYIRNLRRGSYFVKVGNKSKIFIVN